MNYKIIETGSKYPDVLVFRDRDGDGNEIAIIHAIGTESIEDIPDYFFQEQIKFENNESVQMFIKHFSKSYAESWCRKQNAKY